jgi:hypothetical protein
VRAGMTEQVVGGGGAAGEQGNESKQDSSSHMYLPLVRNGQ